MNEKLFGKKPKHYRLKKHISQTSSLPMDFPDHHDRQPASDASHCQQGWSERAFPQLSVYGRQRFLRDGTGGGGYLDPVEPVRQMVLLVLIQLGGLGFISIGIFLSIVLRRKSGLRSGGLCRKASTPCRLAAW